jgi:hypothetical protein
MSSHLLIKYLDIFSESINRSMQCFKFTVTLQPPPWSKNHHMIPFPHGTVEIAGTTYYLFPSSFLSMLYYPSTDHHFPSQRVTPFLHRTL